MNAMLPRPRLAYPQSPAYSFLQRAAELWPEREALRFEGDSYSYRELDSLSNAFANALLGLGLRPGARVFLMVGNCVEWMVANQGILLAGGASVMPNPLWKAAETEHALSLTEPDVIVADRNCLHLVEGKKDGRILIGVGDSLPPGWRPFWEFVRSAPAARPMVSNFNPEGEAALPFSSGTTGLPKAVRHTHQSFVASVINWKSATRVDHNDRLLFFIPLFHIYGLVNAACSFAAGATVHLQRRFDLESMLKTIEREAITVTFAAAPIANAMAQYPDIERYNLGSLRYAMWGATPIDPEIANKVTSRTGVRWLHVYGATEAPGCHCNPVEYPDSWRLDSPGLPVSDLELRVVDLASNVDVPLGEQGEIVVRGPHVMAGYLPASADADAFLPGGWYRTGDVGWQEPDGWIHLTDRAKEMIKVSGFSVAPAEIERVLAAHPAVADCAVFGMPDPQRGEVPKAAVVLKRDSSASAEELIAWVGEKLATYKHISAVRFVAAIPRTASGKILRRELKQSPT